VSRMVWPRFRTDWGELRAEGDAVIAGNRMLPTRITAQILGGGGHPTLRMVVEVLDGVPRCTEVTLQRVADGREVRPRDLDAVDIEEFVETFTAAYAGEIRERTSEHAAAEFPLGSDDTRLRESMKQIRDLRKGSRRTPPDIELRRVAEIYNATPSGDRYGALETAFGYSRATTKRRIAAARHKGFIPTKKES